MRMADGGRSVLVIFLLQARGQHRRIVGFTGNDARVWRVVLESAANAGNRSTSAKSADECIKRCIGKTLHYFHASGRCMDRGVVFVLELMGQEPTVLFGKLACF